MGRKKKNRGAKFAEGDRVVNFAHRACEENGGHAPEGTVLRATKKNGFWQYQVQVAGSDRIATWDEMLMGAVDV